MTVIREPGTRRELGSSGRPLLEREAELETLRTAVESTRNGDGQLVMVEGAAGIGKTRLLGEARSLATEFEVLSARAGELESDFAFGIVRQLFEGALVAAPADVRAELLSGAAGLAAPLFAVIPGEPEPGGAETSFAMLHGLYWLAANLALRRPTLLVVDDLHWADEPSLRWLGYLARRLEGLTLLVLAATRPAEQAHTPALVTELLADPLATVLRPGALGQQSAATLAQVLFGLESDEPFAAALREASGGNPLYLTALLDAVAREKIEPTTAQAARLPTLGGDAVARGVGLRLSRLTPEVIAVIRAAAILGDGSELRHVATLAELEASAAGQAASMLVRCELLRQEQPLEFIHPVVRTAVLRDIDVGERMRLHRRAARTLLDAGSPPEQAAAHLQQTIPAGDSFVVATMRTAARRLLSRGSPESAAAYLRRALDEIGSGPERTGLLRELGIAELHVDPEKATAHLSEAIGSIEGDADYADAMLAYGLALVWVNRWHESVEVMRAGLGRLGGEPTELGNRLRAYLIAVASYTHENAGFLSDLTAELPLDEIADGDGAALLQSSLALYEARVGRDRERVIRRARAALQRRPVPASSALEILLGGAVALGYAGEAEQATAHFDALLAETQRRGDVLTYGVMLMCRGQVHLHRGDLGRAEEDLRSAEVNPYGSLARATPDIAGLLAEVLADAGDVGQALSELERVSLAETVPGLHVHFLVARARLRLEAGQPAAALEDLETVGRHAESMNFSNPAFLRWRSQAALAFHRLGQLQQARELAREELELSRRWGAPRAIGISLRALGLVEGGAGGEELLREAVEVLAASPARLEHARVLIDLGAALRRANSRSEARKHLHEGVDLAQRCGASALVAHGNEELAATGAHPRKVMLSGLKSLTASERRVAQLAAEEVSNKEIAQALFVTVKTVEMHLSRVYRKLDITSRRQLAGALSAPAVKTAANS